MFEPSYLKLYRSGEFKRRLQNLKQKLETCTVCPHECGTNRYQDNSGICETYTDVYVCSYCPHHGEEPPLSGMNGSGTIFLGRCNLRCVFCQNADISQAPADTYNNIYTPKDLARMMLELQDVHHCHNINFVSPSHFVPQLLEAIGEAIPMGLNLPIVYNSNGYDHLETLRLLDGIVDIYLPDLKYASNAMAMTYSGISQYVRTARRAIREMFRQTGLLQTDDHGIAKRGLLIRHLVLPNDISGSIECLNWIGKELSNEVSVSLMAQYYPAHRAADYPLISRTLTIKEYGRVLHEMKQLGFKNALYQEISSAHVYRPDFQNRDNPFE